MLLDVEGHGREDVTDGTDLSRTVGWFTSLFPVRLEAELSDWDDVWAAGPTVGAALKRVKEQVHALPDHGIGYGLLRHLNAATAGVLAEAGPPQIGFNYLGRFTTASGSPDWEPDHDFGGFSGGADPGLPTPDLVDVLPLTALQEGLVFHAAYDDRAPDVYNVQLGIDLEGPLNAGTLREAAEALLSRLSDRNGSWRWPYPVAWRWWRRCSPY